MKGKNAFTEQEIEELRELIRKRVKADRIWICCWKVEESKKLNSDNYGIQDD